MRKVTVTIDSTLRYEVTFGGVKVEKCLRVDRIATPAEGGWILETVWAIPQQEQLADVAAIVSRAREL